MLLTGTFISAWREFIALNRVAMDPATTGTRGRPNINIDFWHQGRQERQFSAARLVDVPT
jgi:hypothetical protein